MSEDEDELRRRIAMLADEGRTAGPEGRPLVAPEGGDLFAAILAEIDETILPRRLTLRAGDGEDGAALVLDVSSGRLRRIAAGPGEAGGLAGRALSRDDGAAAAAVISAFAGAAGAVLVVSDPTEDEVGASGVSTTRLAAEAPASGDLPPAAEAPAAEAPESGAGGSGDPVTDPAGAFQVAAAEARAGILYREGAEAPETAGDAGRVESLAGEALEATRKARHAAGPVNAVFLGVADGLRLVAAGAPGCEAIFLAEPAAAERILAVWRRIPA